jgi:DNA-binding transcriptional LysR family regulator
MFELSQLRCFVAVAEELHFHRAAAKLHMTQPPLSRQIQLLEHKLGLLLLLRGSRSVRLTPAGEAFLRDARRMLQLAEAAALRARRIALGESGQITLGFTAASSYGFMPRLVSLIRAKLPEVTLNLREMVSLDQMEALQSGGIDLGLLRPISRRLGVLTVPVQREPLLLALPQTHPLAALERVAVAELAGEPLITYPPMEGRYLHDVVAALLRLSGVVPDRVQHISQTHSILALVGAGLGIALVPQAAARLRPREVVLRPLEAPHPTMVELILAWRAENDNPAGQALLAMLRRHWAELCEDDGPPPALLPGGSG